MKESERLGRALYVIDKASAMGTDVMLEHIKDPPSAGIGGWLTLDQLDESKRPTGAFDVLFLTPTEPYRIVCEVAVGTDEQTTFKRHDPPREASPLVASLFKARQAALAAVPRNGQPLNPVVFSGQAFGVKGVIVYLLAGTKRAGEMVFGLHHRAIVSEDGSRVTSMVPLSKTAMVISDRDLPPGAKPVESAVSQILTDWPLETHVLASLLHGNHPVSVVTKLGVWRVVGDKITFETTAEELGSGRPR